MCRIGERATAVLKLCGESEWFVKELSSKVLDMSKIRKPGTRLTQERRWAAVGSAVPENPPALFQQILVASCGTLIAAKSRSCLKCAREEAAEICGSAMRQAGQSPEALKKRSESMRRSRGQQLNWSPSELPSWLTGELYARSVQPLLKTLPRTATASTLGVTTAYIRPIISGKRMPNKRHWAKLAELVGVNALRDCLYLVEVSST